MIVRERVHRRQRDVEALRAAVAAVPPEARDAWKKQRKAEIQAIMDVSYATLLYLSLNMDTFSQHATQCERWFAAHRKDRSGDLEAVRNKRVRA